MIERKEELKNYTDENGEVFNGDIPEGMKIIHIDGNKTNNALSNLKLKGTHSG